MTSYLQPPAQFYARIGSGYDTRDVLNIVDELSRKGAQLRVRYPAMNGLQDAVGLGADDLYLPSLRQKLQRQFQPRLLLCIAVERSTPSRSPLDWYFVQIIPATTGTTVN